MRDIAKEAYEKTVVGGVGFMRPDPSTANALQEFQNVYRAAKALVDDGLIFILMRHRENQSAEKLIDLIQFKRLK